MLSEASRSVQKIRASMDHPIVDAHAHQLETLPVVLDYLRDVGGRRMPERFVDYLAHQRRTFSMTPEERLDTRIPMPVWWPVPSENTLDRATSQLPRLFYERMDERDFADFTFGNAVRLHGGMNPDFFKGTVVEEAAAKLLAGDADARQA